MPEISHSPVSASDACSVPACKDCHSTDVFELERLVSPNVYSYGDIERQLDCDFQKSCLYECRRCSLRFRFPQPNDCQLEKMYRSLNADRWDYEPSCVSSWTLGRKHLLNEYRTGEVQILDVGAFDGSFLAMLPDPWIKSAIEPSAAAAEILNSRDIACIGRFLGDAEKSMRNTFDAVTLFDVFEHLPCPLESLNQAVRVLKPHGQMLISTGDSDHWSWKLLGGNHWYFSTVQHVSFASVKYFHRVAPILSCRVVNVIRHAHQLRPWAQQMQQAIETVHFSSRLRGGLARKMSGAIQRLPLLHYLTHRHRAPHTPALRDHLLVVFEKL